ncbi:ELMO/CED-12 family protein [Actinidia rufa]|uniref:ELMO/CED-12 family protein n=1 Tax=Actinidia rufa TaxID=165716 RepID=A0A7J0GF09_9ERIC|nr:ELMO/CED-12 family protein [Actinidia rufa]
MTSRTLRRRLHHGDVGGKNHEHFETSGLEGLDEPLLGNYDHDDKHSEGNTLADNWDDERKKENLHWTLLFSQLIAQWAQWLANIVVGSGTLIGRLFPFHSTTRNGQTMKLIQPSLSPLQEERLRNLQRRLQVPFDGSLVEHQDALQQLWRLAYPDRELPSLKSELWKEMGWQGSDPSTDFRQVKKILALDTFSPTVCDSGLFDGTIQHLKLNLLRVTVDVLINERGTTHPGYVMCPFVSSCEVLPLGYDTSSKGSGVLVNGPFVTSQGGTDANLDPNLGLARRLGLALCVSHGGCTHESTMRWDESASAHEPPCCDPSNESLPQEDLVRSCACLRADRCVGHHMIDLWSKSQLVIHVAQSDVHTCHVLISNVVSLAWWDAFQSLLHKRDGTRAEWEYPFAVAGINLSFMLVQMLDLQSGKPTTMAGIRFLELLSEDEMAFDNLYCVAFQMMDAQWLAKRASYMEFNDVLKSTRTQLERELALEDVFSVRDLPAYNLLKR